MKKLLLILPLFFLFFRSLSFAATTYPDYQGYVNDFAHVLSADTVSQLNTKLQDLDTKTTDQIAVVTVNTTDPDPIEDYSIHLADKWKVGQKGKDNGVIMLFAMQDHSMRMEVGRGLEGDLTDIQSSHIQSDIISPEFKQGNYDAGVEKGVDAVIAAITHNASAAAALAQSAQPSSQSSDISSFIIFIIIIIIMVIALSFSPFTPLGGRGTLGPTIFWGGGGTGGNGGGGFGGFGGGGFSGGGSSGSW